jgi:hypothetical protein
MALIVNMSSKTMFEEAFAILLALVRSQGRERKLLKSSSDQVMEVDHVDRSSLMVEVTLRQIEESSFILCSSPKYTPSGSPTPRVFVSTAAITWD